MKNDLEFKASILEKRDEMLRRRKVRISALSTVVLCLMLGVCLPFLFPEMRIGADKAAEEDVIVYIYVNHNVSYTDWSDVGPRLEALGKYAPLPEGAEDVYDGTPEVFNPYDEVKDSVSNEDSAPGPGDATVDNATTDNALSTGPCVSPESAKRSCVVTVFAGSSSVTYALREDSLTVDGVCYPLTEAQFEELWALFGEEAGK